MRAPLQQGAFPFPVKYGYCAVGRVEFGPDFLRDKIVFCLHPHQDRFVASANSVVVVRGEVPPKRATLASNMETALNAHWDAGTRPGDRINVIGGGIVGLLIAAVAERIPGSEVVLVDISEEIHRIAAALGITSARPDELSKRALADVVFHTSASAAGLQTAIDCAAQEATVVEVSWYGSREVAVKLGGAFHAKRLRLVSSQVGAVATPQRTRWTHRRRIEKALDLLTDPKLDLLVEGEVPFTEAPDRMADILSPDATGLPPVFAYDAAD
ncbi:MAG: zinc-binding alcohol dehydrogenase [Pseudomonadota bacterium]